MDRLSALDAEFLHLEDTVSPMHIAGICVFAGTPPTMEELNDAVSAKLHALPRYRQVVRSVPLELGRPIWVDDPAFHLDRHLHRAALPHPGGDAELDELMGRLMAHPLDRARPLWEAWLVEGLNEDRWALVFKVHHCMVDGVAGVHLLEAFLDPSPEVPPLSPAAVSPWRPEPEPSPAAKVVGSWVGLAGDLVPWARRLADAVTSPVDTLRSITDLGSGLGWGVAHLTPTPPLNIRGSIGAHRSWSHTTLDLGDVAKVRRRFGGTINDVLLTCVTAGYRALLIAHGDDPDHAVVRTAVPVNVRDTSRHADNGNHVSALLIELPVSLTDPVERLSAVCQLTQRAKASHMAQAAETLTILADLAPPMAVGSISRLAARVEHRLAQRSITTITTNVPGPPFPLYCLGREMLEELPYLGLTEGVRVSTAILSYNGRISVGVTGDEGSVPDVRVATDAVTRTLAELVTAARRRTRTT